MCKGPGAGQRAGRPPEASWAPLGFDSKHNRKPVRGLTPQPEEVSRVPEALVPLRADPEPVFPWAPVQHKW